MRIHLKQDADKERVDVKNFVTKWNDLRPDTPFDWAETMTPDVPVCFVNVTLTKTVLDELQDYLKQKPDLAICLFMEQRERQFIPSIEKLERQYPFATIGTILKPTQYSRVGQFLASTLNRRGMVVVADDWDDFDFDIDEHETT